jgi:hypothetical protein
MIATIILFVSIFFIFEPLFSQLPDNNKNNAFAQSELIATTSGNNAPSTIFLILLQVIQLNQLFGILLFRVVLHLIMKITCI